MSRLTQATSSCVSSSICAVTAPADTRRGLQIVPEATTHAVAPWRPTDRPRRYVRFRFKHGAADTADIAGGARWDAEAVARFAPATRAIIAAPKL